MNRTFATVLAFLSVIAQTSDGRNLLVPSGYDNSPGEVNNVIPFTWNIPRYQQIYGASDLGFLAGKLITGIAFRVDERDGFDGDYGGGFTYSSLEIRFSITPRGVDQLSTDLDANPGSDTVTVYSGPYMIPPLEGDLAVNPFDLRITFQTPFAYAGGNLLIDIVKPNVRTTLPHLDAVSRVAAVNRAYIDISGSPRAGEDSLGLVTQFEYVPEPTSAILACFSIFAVIMRFRLAR